MKLAHHSNHVMISKDFYVIIVSVFVAMALFMMELDVVSFY